MWRLKASIRRKLAIAVILSSGIFVITAAIVRAKLTLDSLSSTTTINSWGVRETIIGLITVNIPILRPLATRAFWRRGPYDPEISSGSAGTENEEARPTLITWGGGRIGGGSRSDGRSTAKSWPAQRDRHGDKNCYVDDDGEIGNYTTDGTNITINNSTTVVPLVPMPCRQSISTTSSIEKGHAIVSCTSNASVHNQDNEVAKLEPSSSSASTPLSSHSSYIASSTPWSPSIPPSSHQTQPS